MPIYLNIITLAKGVEKYVFCYSGEQCVGCEHNQEEASKVAAYLSNYHGQKFSIMRNGVDAVRAAKEFRSEVFRVKNREMILKEMESVRV